MRPPNGRAVRASLPCCENRCNTSAVRQTDARCARPYLANLIDCLSGNNQSSNPPILQSPKLSLEDWVICDWWICDLVAPFNFLIF